MPLTAKAEADLDVVIIGAGFAGLAMAYHLKQIGVERFAILERGDGVGGVWRANTYPGAACDVPSQLYSFSFFLNPDWSRKYPAQEEILDYMQRAADELDITPHVRANHNVTSLRFDNDRRCWHIALDGQADLTARAVVSAVGQLAEPAYPDIAGLEDFKGPVIHTAHWDDKADFTGQRVAVIGNAASAIQLIPRVAETASELTVFQRTANWMIGKPDRAFTAFEKALFRAVPLWQRFYRRMSFLIHEARFLSFVSGSLANKSTTWQMRQRLKREVADPSLRAALTPDYEPGCKRILLSNDYFATLQRDHVHLVTERAQSAEPDAILTPSGQRIDADAVILATGFHATEFLASLDVIGRDNQSLAAHWNGAPSAYNGLAVHGFPNLFMLYGPNTNLGHNSIIYMIEQQARYAAKKLKTIVNDDVVLDVRAQAETQFNDHTQAKLAKTVWAKDCGSWYRTDQGIVTNNWYGLCTSFAHRLARDDSENWSTL